MSPKQRRGHGKGNISKNRIALVVLALVLAGWLPPAASFTVGESKNGQSVNVVGDVHGSVSLNKTTELDAGVSDNCLVRVTNRLGSDATVELTLADGSQDLGILKTDPNETGGGNSVELSLSEGATDTVYMDVDEGTDGNTTYYTVNTTAAGSVAVLSDRSSPVKDTAGDSCE